MEVRITRRHGRPISLSQLGYFFLAIYLAFVVETLFVLRPGQLTSEYMWCERFTEVGWVLVAGMILVCNRSTGSSAERFELSIIPLLSYIALFFALVYIAVPFIGWNAATRMNSLELQQTLSVREGSRRELDTLKARIAQTNSLAGLEAIPGVQPVLAANAITDLGTAKRTVERVFTDRAAALDQQATGETAARARSRLITIGRLVGQCAVTVLFCVWIWARSRAVRYDFEIA